MRGGGLKSECYNKKLNQIMGLVLYMCELGWGKGDMQLWSRVIIGLLIVGDAEGFECVWKKFHYHLKKSIQNKIRIPPQKKKKKRLKSSYDPPLIWKPSLLGCPKNMVKYR